MQTRNGDTENMTFVCPECGYEDSPIWKPLAWKLYVSYASYDDFIKEHPLLAMEKGKTVEDMHYVYRRLSSRATRDLVHRYAKAFKPMMVRKLYEKTPSERVRV